MGKDIPNLVFAQLGEHRNGNAPECGDGKEGHRPVGHILGEDGDFVVGVDAEIGQQARDASADFFELCIVISSIFLTYNAVSGTLGVLAGCVGEYFCQ